MLLAYRDVANLFVEKQGIRGDFLFFSVTDQADVTQPKGLFIPVNEESGSLSRAIENGAIAAVWDKQSELPAYTPNHFPVFFTSDCRNALQQIIKIYYEKLIGETEKKMVMTDFKISNKKLLNKSSESYDIAVMLKKIKNWQETDSERRG